MHPRVALLSVPTWRLRPTLLLLRVTLPLPVSRLLSIAALLTLSACVSSPADTESARSTADARPPSTPTRIESGKRSDEPGHSLATAVQLSGANNPLVFSQKQQEWLWLHYRDWKKQGQALREQDGVQYDEVTLINKRGEKRVIYFRMPKERAAR